jgi:phage gp29-like protein
MLNQLARAIKQIGRYLAGFVKALMSIEAHRASTFPQSGFEEPNRIGLRTWNRLLYSSVQSLR